MDDHFGSSAVIFLLHEFFCASQAFFNCPALFVIIGSLFFCLADPVKATMFCQVIQYASPFFTIELAVECFST